MSAPSLPLTVYASLPIPVARSLHTHQVVVINFTGEYARVVQGALVCADSDPDIKELRVSVSENMKYLDSSTGAPIFSVWTRLLGWTLSRGVKAEKGDVGAGAAQAASTT